MDRLLILRTARGQGLFDFRQEARIFYELSDAMRMIFFEYVVLTPVMQAVDIDLGALRTNTPGNLHG